MPNYTQRHETATSSMLAWRQQNAKLGLAIEDDVGADTDEPPDHHPLQLSPVTSRFPKAAVRRGNDQHHQSLLTRALQTPSDDEAAEPALDLSTSRRRRSLTSNISLASTAELTSDTGVTSPARTSSPSPRLPSGAFAAATADPVDIQQAHSGLAPLPKTEASLSHVAKEQHGPVQGSGSVPPPAVEKKRCISFACGAKPVRTDTAPVVPTVKTEQKAEPAAAPKRPCIKFACPARPQSDVGTAKPLDTQEATPKHTPQRRSNESSPASIRKQRSPSVGRRGGRSLTPRRASQPTRAKKFLSGENLDLQTESSRFHEFATDEPQEDDWIRQDKTATRRKLTIDDTLKMELEIRRLGKEAEEEAEQEENDDDAEAEDGALDEEDENEDEDEEDEDDEDEDQDEDDDASGYSSDDDGSDGYNTDNEVGFASSDDEDDDLVLWTTRQPGQLSLSGATPMERRPSLGEHSDSSSYSGRAPRQDKPKNRELGKVIRSGTPELPDSTDFVCGTLDEDRPLEEAYLSCLAARKREKLRVIPQDIDPSFPTSDPEDEADEDTYKAGHDSDEQLWLHGEIEDLDHEHHERADRRKKKGDSPKRYRSPPPKRHFSPPPKVRGRSPRRLPERHSPPKRWRSPAPRQKITPPNASPIQNERGVIFEPMAPRPNITHTKSLPRPGAGFTNMKHRRNRAPTTSTKDKHVRGAIDIVKGLEQKRQRRKEKFHQKYCNRARKGQVPEKRPQPGKGAERMKELGLIMAGKIGPGNYVLSI
ncbi:uncharacterized protein E0L32_000993 [Thyridium curvatum]|uniref:Uncharacterized protein n=1 Tax=Thyridium curvatum TaxID=1093900 RepID=A0A507AKU9_9PEZI|nr:uncharacterized protein E0L32_000993 [Thyridium curvatum]TPX11175.1 hypothetical protein E0L32_000993 [Thyridium curvatum]